MLSAVPPLDRPFSKATTLSTPSPVSSQIQLTTVGNEADDKVAYTEWHAGICVKHAKGVSDSSNVWVEESKATYCPTKICSRFSSTSSNTK